MPRHISIQSEINEVQEEIEWQPPVDIKVTLLLQYIELDYYQYEVELQMKKNFWTNSEALRWLAGFKNLVVVMYNLASLDISLSISAFIREKDV